MTLRCPACGFEGPNLDPASCGRCGVVFARFHSPGVPSAQSSQAEVPAARPTSAGVLVAVEPTPENLWALPVAFLAAAALNASGWFGRTVIFSSASNWAHELGHASWRWLNGRDAVPALFVTFYFGDSRSVVTTVLVFGGLAGLFAWARSQQCAALERLAIAFALVFVGFAIAIPAAREHFLESFAGLFGELWIGTLWVVLFYYRFPPVVRWRNLRWVFLLLGALSFTRITGIFLASRHDMSRMPWGSFWGGDGDLDHLLDPPGGGGWSVPKIRAVYLTIAAIGGVVMLAHYVYFARRALKATAS